MIYPKLAFDGIRKNKRLYLPYILTCVGMVTMTYIIDYLHYSKTVSEMKDGSIIGEILYLGNLVIAFFSCIFLFYTNSFIIKRRKKEFGLYNILGMGKHNLGMIILWETAIVAAISIIAGLAFGILLSKFAELVLLNIIDFGINRQYDISVSAVIDVTLIFLGIFALLLINSIRQIRFSTAINLLKSESLGEKPPKANWFLGIAGVALLGVAYYLAVTITNPLAAIMTFFFAVLMVIAGTYLVMISGSVMFCRLLQKFKGYYYRPNHFVSVSSMAFRMKRNGAGLASICILATMVLVMISSTSSLYFGEEEALMIRYPREINAEIQMDGIANLSEEKIAMTKKVIDEAAEKSGAQISNVISYTAAQVTGVLKDGVVETDVTSYVMPDLAEIEKGLYVFYFVPLEEYNRIYGTRDTLESGEAMIYYYRDELGLEKISFNNGNTLKVVKSIDAFYLDGDATMMMFPSIVLVVDDLEEALGGLLRLADFNGDRMVTTQWVYNFDTGLDPDGQVAATANIWEALKELDKTEYGIYSRSLSGREDSRREFMELYGGLFFLGIMLSIVFLFAAVLIIYYKQISEGYEDCGRFGIMKKVGMTDRDIRKSINSQLLTVFFLPLVFAALHLFFAFPIVKRLLMLFNLNNISETNFFAIVCIACFAVFAVLYTLVYKVTSASYYRIVSGRKEDAR